MPPLRCGWLLPDRNKNLLNCRRALEGRAPPIVSWCIQTDAVSLHQVPNPRRREHPLSLLDPAALARRPAPALALATQNWSLLCRLPLPKRCHSPCRDARGPLGKTLGLEGILPAELALIKAVCPIFARPGP